MSYREEGSRRRDEDIECKVYVGDLSRDASENDLEKEFGTYGRYVGQLEVVGLVFQCERKILVNIVESSDV